MLALAVAALLSTDAPVQASFDEDGGTAELEMRCEVELKGKVRCHFLQARLEETGGACVFRTQRFEYELEARGPHRWVHTETTPCETTLTVELTSQETGAITWTYVQTRSGTPVDSEFCRASSGSRPVRFVPGGGKRRPARCTSVAMALG